MPCSRRLSLMFAGLLWAAACSRPPLLSPGPDGPVAPGRTAAPAPEATPCDRDGDGHLSPACGGDDCDDGSAAIHPGAPDLNATPGAWKMSRVIANTGGAASGTAIAVDRAGVVHIAYSGRTARGILYARRAGATWQVELVEPFSAPYFTSDDRPAIAVDARGGVHLAYRSADGIQYALRTAQGWAVETIDPAGQPPPAIAVGPDGTVHVAYTTNAGLRYAARRDGAWVGEIVDPLGELPSIAVDGQGNVHLSYADPTKGHEVLRYATTAAGAWVAETASQTRAGLTSIVIDAGGVPRIAVTPRYIDGSGVPYLVRGGGHWSQTMVPANEPIYSAALRLDATGAPHVLFTYLGDALYAVRQQDDDDWRIEWPPYGNYDVAPSFDLDGAGVAHVASTSFFYPNNIDVEYSTNRQLAPDGIDQDCDGVDGVDADRDGHASLDTGGDDCADDDRTSPVGCQL